MKTTDCYRNHLACNGPTCNFEALHWTPTGTTVTGDGYGFTLLKSADDTFTPLLAIGRGRDRVTAIGRVGTFSDAYEQGHRFAYTMRVWFAVKSNLVS